MLADTQTRLNQFGPLLVNALKNIYEIRSLRMRAEPAESFLPVNRTALYHCKLKLKY